MLALTKTKLKHNCKPFNLMRFYTFCIFQQITMTRTMSWLRGNIYIFLLIQHDAQTQVLIRLVEHLESNKALTTSWPNIQQLDLAFWRNLTSLSFFLVWTIPFEIDSDFQLLTWRLLFSEIIIKLLEFFNLKSNEFKLRGQQSILSPSWENNE
jgi:hypothetical protein